MGTPVEDAYKSYKELKAELNNQTYRLDLLRKQNPKIYHRIKRRIQNTIDDITEAFKNIDISDQDIDTLSERLKELKNLQKRFF